MVEESSERSLIIYKWSLHLLKYLAKLSLFSNIVLNGHQQESYIRMTAAWFLSPGHWHLDTTQQYW